MGGERGPIPKRTSATTKTLFTAIKLSIAVFFIEAIGGFYTGSLALLSDASHVFSDLLALIITLFAIWIASRPATLSRTFGYHRAEVFGALFNALLLLLMAVSIAFEAWRRIQAPPEVRGLAVIIVGLIGVLPNIWTVLRLRASTNINIKSAFLHALGDTISSVVVIASGVLIAVTGMTIFDPLASLLVVVILALGALRLMRHVFVILLEGAPLHIDRERISKMICALPGVRSTHDVHLWTLCSDVVYFTGHLVVEDHPTLQNAQEIIARATSELDKKGVHHATIQVETTDHSCAKEEACEIIH